MYLEKVVNSEFIHINNNLHLLINILILRLTKHIFYEFTISQKSYKSLN